MNHLRIDERSIALHRAIARKLIASPELVEVALGNIRRWLEQGSGSALYLREWNDILQKPIEEIAELIVSKSEHMCELRQSTPFCGILTPRERWKIYESF